MLDEETLDEDALETAPEEAKLRPGWETDCL